ncbi:MAG: DUF3750 domain-containing protein [Candidatus Pacearchaeota archaeon]
MKHSLSIFSCPASLPFIGISHTWFVIKKDNKNSRWEVLWTKNRKSKYGYIHNNTLAPKEGIEIIPLLGKFFWKGKEIIKIEGKEAKSLIKIIESSHKFYPYKNIYKLTGPNSNTYTGWILNKNPKIKIKLPWNAFGKGWKE